MQNPGTGAKPDHSEAGEAGSTPAVVVHGADDVRHVLAAANGRAVTLLSAPGAAGFGGAAWFLAACAEARAIDTVVLDCADAPGRVLQALRAGARTVVFTGPPALAERLALVAREAGAMLLRARPGALDLAAPDAAARLPQWLSTKLTATRPDG